MFGLAEVLIALGRTKDAYNAYKKVIDLDEYSNVCLTLRRMPCERWPNRASKGLHLEFHVRMP